MPQRKKKSNPQASEESNATNEANSSESKVDKTAPDLIEEALAFQVDPKLTRLSQETQLRVAMAYLQPSRTVIWEEETGKWMPLFPDKAGVDDARASLTFETNAGKLKLLGNARLIIDALMEAIAQSISEEN